MTGTGRPAFDGRHMPHRSQTIFVGLVIKNSESWKLLTIACLKTVDMQKKSIKKKLTKK
jgi:hypothetical protein